MTDASFWDRRRGTIRSRKGGWKLGEAVYLHGYSMLDDLLGRSSFFQVLALSATGRMPERRLCDWLEAAFMCISWPDARIWCNQIGALAGTLRASPVAGVTAGVLASDSRLYGPGTSIAAATFIQDALRAHRDGHSAREIVAMRCREAGSKPVIAGYARPVVAGDERVAAMQRYADELGFELGAHVALAYEIDRVLMQDYGESLNLAGYMVAFLSDAGFSPEEIYRTCAMCVNAGVHACYAEACDDPPEAFLPMRCDDVEYQGKPPRPVPGTTDG